MLKNNVIVISGLKSTWGRNPERRGAGGGCRGVGGGSRCIFFVFRVYIALLFDLNFFKTCKVFPLEFFELRIDIFDGIFCPWDNDVLYCVYSAVCSFDDVVEDDKGGLHC